MPTNRTRRRRNLTTGISDELRNSLLTGEMGKNDFFMLSGSRGHLRIPWDAVKDEILANWINRFPGTRPWAWWSFDAKKEPVCGWDYEYFDSSHRKRLGGTGTPRHEVLCVWGGFGKGIPKSWVSKFEEEYYNGRALKIHGNWINNGHKDGDFKGVAIDPDDPPVFESEAAYLDRHGHLTASEKRYIEKHPGLMEPERIKITEEAE